MEGRKKPYYRYCLVPLCKNTIRSTPDKVFFSVPQDLKIRNQWCKIMSRDKVSPIAHLHCCEDHFNIKEDTRNYTQYSIMKQHGEKVTLQLKEGVVPHKFQCQNRNMPPPKERKYAIKKQNETLSEFNVKSASAVKSESLQKSLYEAGPSTSHIEGSDDYQVKPSTSHMNVSETEPSTLHTEVSRTMENLYCDKAIQVNIKSIYRSKGVHVNLNTENKDVALFPIPLASQNIGTSPIKSTTIVVKGKLFGDKPVDMTSISSNSSITSYYEPCSSSDLSWMQDESEDEKHFKNIMRSGMLTALEK